MLELLFHFNMYSFPGPHRCFPPRFFFFSASVSIPEISLLLLPLSLTSFLCLLTHSVLLPVCHPLSLSYLGSPTLFNLCGR